MRWLNWPNRHAKRLPNVRHSWGSHDYAPADGCRIDRDSGSGALAARGVVAVSGARQWRVLESVLAGWFARNADLYRAAPAAHGAGGAGGYGAGLERRCVAGLAAQS